MDRQHSPFAKPDVGMGDDWGDARADDPVSLGNREDEVSVNHLPQELPPRVGGQPQRSATRHEGQRRWDLGGGTWAVVLPRGMRIVRRTSTGPKQDLNRGQEG